MPNQYKLIACSKAEGSYNGGYYGTGQNFTANQVSTEKQDIADTGVLTDPVHNGPFNFRQVSNISVLSNSSAGSKEAEFDDNFNVNEYSVHRNEKTQLGIFNDSLKTMDIVVCLESLSVLFDKLKDMGFILPNGELISGADQLTILAVLDSIVGPPTQRVNRGERYVFTLRSNGKNADTMSPQERDNNNDALSLLAESL